MPWQYLIAISIFSLGYGSLNFYIGLRGWQAMSGLIPSYGWPYWLIFWFVVLSYFIGRLGAGFLPDGLGARLTVLGSYWLGAMYYLVLILASIDLIRLIDRKTGLLPSALKSPGLAALGVALLILAIMAYGSWNARHPRITAYHLEIPKKAGAVTELHIAAISDIHLGNIVDNRRLQHLVTMVNGLRPDLILLPGDVIDESINPFIEQKMADTLGGLDSRYGTYAVLGNHEYLGGEVEETVHHLEEAGVQVLRDRQVLIAGSFYLAGRDEKMGRGMGSGSRLALADILAGIDRTRPVIMMDHQPIQLDEADRNGVDLQISGHTHLGQLFPNQFITRRVFEIDYGYLAKGNLQAIVSCGFGTWGPPIRIGNTPEIVEIWIKFTGR